MKSLYRSRILLMFISIIIIFSTGCEKKVIQGEVNDVFGNKVDGVAVKILKSAFSTSTDKSGQYFLDYVPGSFTIHFSKHGYTSHTLELSIEEKAAFPATPITIYPKPSGQGIYYIGEKELIKLPISRVRESMINSPAWGKPHTYKYYARSTNNNPLLPSGKASFIDTYPETIKPALLNSSRLIQHYTWSIANPYKSYYNGLMNEQTKRIGQDNLLIRSIDLKPGGYAWVEVIMDRNPSPGSKSVCFPFEVN